MLLNDALRAWLEKKGRTWTPHVYEYTAHLAEGWKKVLGAVDLNAVTPRDVERIEATRDDGRRSASALNGERGYLKAFFAWAMKLGYCRQNPVTTWPFRRVTVKKQYVCLSAEDEARLLEKCEPWLARYVRFAILTGLREGTIRQLRWEWVQDSPRRLEIPAAAMKARQALTLPITAKMVTCLGAVVGTGLVFPDLPGATSLWKAFKKAVWQAGIDPSTSPHDLRRTFVGRLSAHGTPLQTIMRLGGWRSAGVLLNHYCGQVQHDVAVEALNAI